MESVLVGAFGVNCLLLWESGSETAVVVDPGAEPDAIVQALQRHGLRAGAYWLTHGHIDHISALPGLLAVQPAEVVLHPADAAWAFTSVNQYPPYVRVPTRPGRLVSAGDGDVLRAGGLEARVLHTPGHTPGGVCYRFEAAGLLVCGDTLFQGSVGRTDLPGGDWETLRASLGRLMTLDDAVKVVPGHGPESTVGDERRNNPFLRDLPLPGDLPKEPS